jgi:hypothetical protein
MLILAMFAAIVATAAILVSGSDEPLVFAVAVDEASPVEAEPAASAPRFGHVKAFLASVPDTKNLVSAARGAPLTHARSVTLRHFRSERIVPGAIELRRNDQTVGLFQNWMDLVPVDSSRFVLHRAWHGPEVILVAVSVADLRPLGVPDLVQRAESIGSGEELFALDEATCAEARIPRDLEPGQHAFDFPDCIRAVDEVLVMYPSTRTDAPNRMHVMRVVPRAGRVTVIAPVNRAFWRFDEAHAPIRLLREPRTGRAVGDGLGVGAFVLSESLDAVEAWLD